MRKLSDFEKDIVKTMLDLNTNGDLVVLNNICTKLMSKKCIPPEFYVKLENNTDIYTLIPNNEADLKSIDNLYFKTIFSLIYFLSYLEDNKLIILDQIIISGETYIGRKSQKLINSSFPYYIFTNSPPYIPEKLYRYSTHRFFISPTLINYANIGFKSEDEIKHKEQIKILKDQVNTMKKQSKYTMIALIISLLGLLASIFISIYQIRQPTKMLIEGPQIESMSNSLQTMSQK